MLDIELKLPDATDLKRLTRVWVATRYSDLWTQFKIETALRTLCHDRTVFAIIRNRSVEVPRVPHSGQ